MHQKLNETLLGVFACWLGLHLVAFSIYSSGNATYENFAWRMLSPLLYLELLIIQSVVAISIIFAVILFTVHIFGITKNTPKPDKKPARRRQPSAETTIRISAKAAKPKHEPDSPKPPEPIVFPPPKPPPTAKELKQKAIEQITGRSI